ncbi:hypothetical protein [Halobacteriovorax marinus]|uniref:hypothetical protein n=1 Tax=Halobacteriovorax marinus TaxID=97084 RepID=UPI003A8E3773
MKVLLIFLTIIFMGIPKTLAQGLYTDYGIERIYCFAENADIEIELSQVDNIHHSFKTIGRDIFKLNELRKVESIPNGVTFYLSNVERSPISFILDNEDNVLIEGLSAITDFDRDFRFHCDIE